MCVLVIGAFTGFEATAIYAEEARDPCRKVSRATFIAIGFLTVFHAAGCWLIMGAFGADRAVDLAGEAAGPDLTFRAAELHVGAWLADAMHGLFTVSAFAATFAFHNAAARHLYELRREGLLPRRLGRVSGRHGSPGGAVVAQSVFDVVLIAAGALLVADRTARSSCDQQHRRPRHHGHAGLRRAGRMGVLPPGPARHARRPRGVVPAPFLRRSGRARRGCRRSLRPAATGVVNPVLLVPLQAVLLTGFAVAWWIRRRDPERYAALTTVDVERDMRVPAVRHGHVAGGGDSAPQVGALAPADLDRLVRLGAVPAPPTVAARSPPRPAFPTKANAPQP